MPPLASTSRYTKLGTKLSTLNPMALSMISSILLEAVQDPSSSQQTPCNPLSISNILLEAIKLPLKKLTVIIFTIISIVTSFLKSYPLPIVPVDPCYIYSTMIDAILAYIVLTYMIPIVLFIFSCINPIMIIYALQKNAPSMNDVGVLKRSLTTTFFVVVFYQGFSSLVGSLSSTLKLRGPDAMIPEISDAVLSLADTGYLKCFDMILAVSLMISMVEERCYGWEAIYKAIDVVAGRKWEVAMLLVVEVLIIKVIDNISNLAILVAGDDTVEAHIPLLVQKAVFAMVGVFEMAVSSVFYFECKKSNVNNGEEKIVSVAAGATQT